MKKLKNVILVIIILIGYAACKYNTINQITKDPYYYQGQEVKLKGIVRTTTHLPLLNLKLYIIEDKTDEVLVKTDTSLPDKGSKVIIKGIVKTVFTIKDKSFGIYIQEIKRSKYKKLLF